MKNILFVDDESMILEGLRNVLRRHRSRWNIVFANSAAAAMAACERIEFDIVVSDMRMPGMDGAALLDVVRQRQPGAARVLFTGHATGDELLRGLRAAHQQLSKPCDPAALVDALERLCWTQAQLPNNAVRAAIGRLDSLPAFASSWRRLTTALDASRVNPESLVDILQSDPALCARVLQMANSPLLGAAERGVVTVRAALRRLGIQVLATLTHGVQLPDSLDASLLAFDAIRNLQYKSMEKAHLARDFVTDRALAEEAFTTAMLLDVGKVLLACCCREPYLEALQVSAATGMPLRVAEWEYCGVTHVQAGAYLLGLWGLPANLVGRIAALQVSLPGPPNDPVTVAVHSADVLVEAMHAGYDNPADALEPQWRDSIVTQGQLAALHTTWPHYASYQ